MHQIRILNMIIQLCLVILVVFLMYKKDYKYLVVSFVLSWFTLVPMTLFKCLQYSSCFYCLIFALIGLLLMKEPKNKKTIPLFFATGILTVYVDFLTYPIITLGIPLAVYLAIKNSSRLKTNTLDIIKHSLAWGLGYIGMWAAKWLIAGPNVIKSALEETGRWTSTGGSKIDNAVTAINNNYEMFMDNKLMIFILIFITVVMTLIIVELKNRKKLNCKKELKTILMTFLPYLIIITIPFVWYIAASNHSKIHYWFTFRDLAVSVFALMIGLWQIYRNLKKKV